jgi:hypothetical protein
MRVVFLSAFVILTMAVAGPTEGQVKKKLPALSFDCKLVRFDEKKGVPTKLYYETSEEDGKKLGFKSTETPITKNTKFIFVGPDGDKTFTQAAVMKNEEARKFLQPDSKIRVTVTALEVEVLRFGPDLKPQGPKRAR